MAIEIERKFLVSGDFKKEAFKATRIKQGYLNTSPERTVRIRISGNRAKLAVKSRGEGISHFEWEKEITVKEAESLLAIAEPGVIDKTRYLIANTDGIHTWEVEEFYDCNEGLTIAEIELSAEDEEFDRPSWLGREVTEDPRYFNSSLSKNPFCTWKQ